MSQNDSTLGQCPNCEEQIPRGWVLVEYERADGTSGIWAECPGCGDVVDPE